jgi:hypothetical protein
VQDSADDIEDGLDLFGGLHEASSLRAQDADSRWEGRREWSGPATIRP